MKIKHRQIAGRGSLPETIPALVRRLYAARGVTDEHGLDLSMSALLIPDSLGGLEAAADLLEKALAENHRILIVADFDADGATSCALMLRGLKMLGASHVDYLVPNRFDYGYGLTPEIVEVAADRDPDLLITVDNGISSVDGVAAAKALGIRVLVTDHHLAGSQLPAADAIVNPNLPGDPFPSKNLAGVGVAFYVLLALRARLRTNEWFSRQTIDEPNLASLLDLVALGTVADVVPLDHNNRILVHQGIRRIRARKCCAGILALLEVSGRDAERLVASDLGFAVGPRLNAAGRLEDMSVGIECLLTDDPIEARTKAQALDELNRARREIEADMQAQALQAINALELDEAGLPRGLCLFDEDWHQGVIGIVAGRIKEKYHRPVIAFARNGEDLKGSARSVPGFHVRDALDAVATRNPGLITKFGGHAMAAGLSLPATSLARFRQAFDEEVSRLLEEEDLQGILNSDGALEVDEMDLETAELLRNSGPWGQGFPEPVFDGRFEIASQRVVGEKHLKLRFRHPGTDAEIDAIAFNQPAVDESALVSPVHIAYRLDVNCWRDQRSVQLMVEHIFE